MEPIGSIGNQMRTNTQATQLERLAPQDAVARQQAAPAPRGDDTQVNDPEKMKAEIDRQSAAKDQAEQAIQRRLVENPRSGGVGQRVDRYA